MMVRDRCAFLSVALADGSPAKVDAQFHDDVYGLLRSDRDDIYSWTELQSSNSNSGPSPRGWSASSAWQRHDGTTALVLQGGLNDRNERLGDLWIMELHSKRATLRKEDDESFTSVRVRGPIKSDAKIQSEDFRYERQGQGGSSASAREVVGRCGRCIGERCSGTDADLQCAHRIGKGARHRSVVEGQSIVFGEGRVEADGAGSSLLFGLASISRNDECLCDMSGMHLSWAI